MLGSTPLLINRHSYGFALPLVLGVSLAISLLILALLQSPSVRLSQKYLKSSQKRFMIDAVLDWTLFSLGRPVGEGREGLRSFYLDTNQGHFEFQIDTLFFWAEAQVGDSTYRVEALAGNRLNKTIFQAPLVVPVSLQTPLNPNIVHANLDSVFSRLSTSLTAKENLLRNQLDSLLVHNTESGDRIFAISDFAKALGNSNFLSVGGNVDIKSRTLGKLPVDFTLIAAGDVTFQGDFSWQKGTVLSRGKVRFLGDHTGKNIRIYAQSIEIGGHSVLDIQAMASESITFKDAAQTSTNSVVAVQGKSAQDGLFLLDRSHFQGWALGDAGVLYISSNTKFQGLALWKNKVILQGEWIGSLITNAVVCDTLRPEFCLTGRISNTLPTLPKAQPWFLRLGETWNPRILSRKEL